MEQIKKEILITGDTLVRDIQKTFNLLYPFLKIEFVKKDINAQPYQLNKITPQHSMKEISNLIMAVNLNVENNRTIVEIEHDCNLMLGLSIRVARKSGNVWNNISITDGWTLENQNNAGEFISTEMKSLPDKNQ